MSNSFSLSKPFETAAVSAIDLRENVAILFFAFQQQQQQ